jgi:hypothetical protein
MNKIENIQNPYYLAYIYVFDKCKKREEKNLMQVYL